MSFFLLLKSSTVASRAAASGSSAVARGREGRARSTEARPPRVVAEDVDRLSREVPAEVEVDGEKEEGLVPVEVEVEEVEGLMRESFRESVEGKEAGVDELLRRKEEGEAMELE